MIPEHKNQNYLSRNELRQLLQGDKFIDISNYLFMEMDEKTRKFLLLEIQHRNFLKKKFKND